MNINEPLICPNCNSKYLKMKHEATYVYTYKINTLNNKNFSNQSENLPFLFDNREEVNSKEYIECEKCGKKYPCSFEHDHQKINLTIVKKAIRSNHQEQPEFWG
ncbi:hypothetical protein [Crassaminicella profunda]|uniref:hypothetical protein n=1 Tax=Crassaminicella profunda TaxID=1286698 RepID=UPI001CA6CB7D|nr:hypothetical protein [Crassaminicella profunda]QZY55746.1 hypothetical protein K7H06_01640 [Crassaminicella profunda]